MTSNTGRSLSNSDYLSFQIPESSTLYVAYDSNSLSIPEWFKPEISFSDAGVYLITDNPDGSNMRLYSKEYVIGNVVLGGADAANNGANANYVVIIVKN